MDLKIVKVGINGEGIGYIDNKPVFVKGALVNEVVSVKNLKEFKGYYTGQLSSIIAKSEDRVKPKCALYDKCDGCNLMHAKVKTQLNYKKNILTESLIKYAHINPKLVNNVIKSENFYNYRNQFKLPVKKVDGVLCSGMYANNSNRFIPLDNCIIHEQELENIRKLIMKILNKYNVEEYKGRNGLRYIVARGFDNQYQVTLVTGNDELDPKMIEEISHIKNIKSLFQNINTHKFNILSNKFKLLYGQETIEMKIDGYRFNLSPASFFQLNYYQAIELYHYVISLIDKGHTLLEAYSGIGVMSILASSKIKNIVGVEIIKDAVINANNNAELNGVSKGVKFVCYDAGKYLQKLKYQIDYLLVDPPRVGLDEIMIESIKQSKPKNIIYVSCNPSTLAKNINDLKDIYKVESIQPFDMFTHTAHVETVVLLTKKD